MTGNDVIEEVLRLLLSGQREEINKLATSVTANATQLTLTYELGGIRAGSLVDIDMETYRVWEVNSTSNKATVEAGMNGTTSAPHTSGALVYVNPRFSRAAIFKALNDELLALSSPSSGLFAVKSVEFTYGGAQSTYDLTGTTDIIDIIGVTTDLPGPEHRWTPLSNWRFQRNSDNTAFASSNALFLPNGIPGRTVRVLYKVPFKVLTNSTDDLATVGLMPASMQDIPVLGILLRLGAVREIKRNFTESQGDSRRSEEVPPNAVQTSFAHVRNLRQQRIDTEAMRLHQQYRVTHR